MNHPPFAILPWDSKTFGYTVASIEQTTRTKKELAAIIADLKEHQVHLAYWMIDPEDRESVAAASINGGFLADQKVTFVRAVGDELVQDDDNGIVSYLHRELNDRVLSLALQSGVYSRYKVDPHFVKGEFETLYRAWIEKSLRGDIAEDVLVCEEGKGVAGLITVGTKNGRGDIGILSVDENFRGKAIGSRLVQAALSHFHARGHASCQVVTQKGNEGACRFYRKCGFEEERTWNVYHFWL